jgi:hypothetical protein
MMPLCRISKKVLSYLFPRRPEETRSFHERFWAFRRPNPRLRAFVTGINTDWLNLFFWPIWFGVWPSIYITTLGMRNVLV